LLFHTLLVTSPSFFGGRTMAVESARKRRKLSPPEQSGESIPGFAQWNLEQNYERRPRKNNKKDERDRLPVKKQNQWVDDERHADRHDQARDNPEEGEAQNQNKDSAVADLESNAPVKRPDLPPKEEIRQAKEDLARIAGTISENPEEYIGLLASLAQIAESEHVTVKKLTLGTQLAVYKDIIPGYRIRPLSKDDLHAKVSKDVRKQRNFEQGLLGGYKDYVQRLDRITRPDSSADASLVSVAASCVCALLTSVPHFNCRNELIAILVRKLSTRTVDMESVKWREALQQLFADDDEGHASLEAISQLTKMIKAKNFNIHEDVLNTFLHLRLLGEFIHKASTNHVDRDGGSKGMLDKRAKQKKEFRSKRERKLLRERKEVEKEMKEADAAVSFDERDKNQAETLKLVFVTYFRILKARTQHLMGAVLEGLAKYAHLINQDFFGDVLETLRDLIDDAASALQEDEDADIEEGSNHDRNATRETLLCIITAFALLQGQQDVAKSADSLHLDLDFFITNLYRTLLPLSLDQDIELSSKSSHLVDPNGLPIPATTMNAKVNVATTTVLLLRSLQAVLMPPNQPSRSIPPMRIAAFTKQLLMLALHLPQRSAAAVLGLLQIVAKAHGAKIAALWNTEERRGDGVFDPLSRKVGGSNPFAANVWEGEILKLHFDPKVREGVRGLERNVRDVG
jgi:nucleolar complex protein 3